MRMNYYTVAPGAVKAVSGLDTYVRSSGLDSQLLELVRLRASHLNGCAYCIDVHSGNARAAGESERRLFALPAWRETPFFTPRERAALAWTEAVTRIFDHGVDDAIYAEASRHFTDKELLDLTVGVIAINAWNRLAVTFQRRIVVAPSAAPVTVASSGGAHS
jgi:AhpD family alkylhydroperoxidase